MTTTADALNADIDRMMWPVIQNGQPVEHTLNSMQEAKLYQRELSGIQTQLRNYKKEINLIKKQVHLSYQNARTNASQHPVMRLFGAKKQANHARAIDRQNLSIDEHNALVPYDNAIDRIDRCIMVLEDLKLKIQQGIRSMQGR
jgi:hypothetical protein